MIWICVCWFEVCCYFFFFKQKTAYEVRISDWSSDVCSSDLVPTTAVQMPSATTAVFKRELMVPPVWFWMRRASGQRRAVKLSSSHRAVKIPCRDRQSVV